MNSAGSYQRRKGNGMSYLLLMLLATSWQSPSMGLLAAQIAAPADPAETPAPAAEPAEGDSTEPPADAPAEEPAADDPTDAEPLADPDNSWLTSLDEFFSSGAIGLMREGGFFMWPILLMAILASGVIIERYRSLKMLQTDSSDVRNKVQTLLQNDQIEEALQLCDREQGPVPAVLSAGLRKYLVLRRLRYDAGRIEEQVVKGMDDYAVHIVAALERHLPILATISSVAPMLGFLGTVQGMIYAFKDIVAQMGETNIVEAAASGIQVSLLTTCFGLIVGIPAYIAFNYFTSVINRFVLEVEESATELIESVTLQIAMSEQEA